MEPGRDDEVPVVEGEDVGLVLQEPQELHPHVQPADLNAMDTVKKNLDVQTIFFSDSLV